MSKVKEALERSLELLEGFSLEDLQKHPGAATLIPMLRALLEQDEECSHVWSDDSTCKACGILKDHATPKEDGPWFPVMFDSQVTIQSQDLTHDVTLKVTGDFSSVQEFYEYARMIAYRLNSFNKDKS